MVNNNLVGGDWNHGMDYDFPIILAMENHPKWLSLHHFSEGWLKPPTRKDVNQIEVDLWN